MPKGLCLRGHDVLVMGRTKHGNCIACRRADQQRATAARRARRAVPHGSGCGCEMCEDRRLEAFMDAAHAQWDEAAWEATSA